DVLTLGKACVFQTLTDRGQEVRGVAGPLGGEEPDHRQRRLLRPHRERPRRHAAEQRNERAALHSITSSARSHSGRPPNMSTTPAQLEVPMPTPPRYLV